MRSKSSNPVSPGNNEPPSGGLLRLRPKREKYLADQMMLPLPGLYRELKHGKRTISVGIVQADWQSGNDIKECVIPSDVGLTGTPELAAYSICKPLILNEDTGELECVTVTIRGRWDNSQILALWGEK